MELILFVLGCWLLWALIKSLSEKAHQRSMRRARERAEAEWRRKDDEDARTPCAMCAAPNRHAHGCFAHAVGRVGRPFRAGGYHGPKKKRWVPDRPETWLGVVYDRYGPGWQCDHHHASMNEAKKCGHQHLRLHQYGDCKCFTVAARAPKGQAVPARRVPIADMPATKWREMCEAAGYRCHYCGVRTERLHREHRVPLARGGANSISNIVPACGPCNLAKGILTDQEFIQMLSEKHSREVRLGKVAARMPVVPTAGLPVPDLATPAETTGAEATAVAVAAPGRVVITQRSTPVGLDAQLDSLFDRSPGQRRDAGRGGR